MKLDLHPCEVVIRDKLTIQSYTKFYGEAYYSLRRR